MIEHRLERFTGHRGLHLAVHRFGRAEAGTATVLLVHGFLDAGSTWDLVAASLADRGLEIVAPDLRGFGQSGWVGVGGYYHFPDYVADLALLVEALAPKRLVLVGHSLGGTVSCLYAGARPARVERLVLLEGAGPPAMDPEIAVTRMRTWLERGERPARKALSSREDAVRRLGFHHPRVAADVLGSRVDHLVEEVGGELFWRFDPLHRTTSPSRFDVSAFKCFLAEIHCPVRFVSGGEAGWHPPDESERLATFPSRPDVVVLEDAGHMMHWTRPRETAEAIATFIQ